MEKLQEVDRRGIVDERTFIVSFDHSRTDMHEAHGAAVDGAIDLGRCEAVSQVRKLAFPHLGAGRGLWPTLSAARWTPRRGAIGLNGRPGADALRGTCGSLSNEPVLRPKPYFSSKVPDAIPMSRERSEKGSSRGEPAHIRAGKSNPVDLGDLSGPCVMAP